MLPSTTSLKSMFPPKRPVSPVEKGAAPKPGATASPPSMGRSGTVKFLRRSVGVLGARDTPLQVQLPAHGLAQVRRLRGEARRERPSHDAVQAVRVVPVQPQALEWTTSVSPGSRSR